MAFASTRKLSAASRRAREVNLGQPMEKDNGVFIYDALKNVSRVKEATYSTVIFAWKMVILSTDDDRSSYCLFPK
jgi:hypothetical protein